MRKSYLYLWLSALSFLATIAVVIAIHPHEIYSHSGISIYGNLSATLIPYSIGLTATAYFILRACFAMDRAPDQAARSFRVGLEAIAIGMLGIVATPSWSSMWYVQDMHIIFGFVIFITQALLSLHYLIRIRGDSLDWVLLSAQCAGIILVGLSFDGIGLLHVMLPAQVLAIFSFGALLIRAVGFTIDNADRHAPRTSA